MSVLMGDASRHFKRGVCTQNLHAPSRVTLSPSPGARSPAAGPRSQSMALREHVGTSLILACALCAQAPKDDSDPGRIDPVSREARESSERALEWLLRAQNHDGSFGDNPGSPGEIGNTCIAALALI